MPQFYAVIEAVADGRRICREFVVNLPEGCGGIDVLRAAEVYAQGRGWRSIVVATGSNGALLREAAPERSEGRERRQPPPRRTARVVEPPSLHAGL